MSTDIIQSAPLAAQSSPPLRRRGRGRPTLLTPERSASIVEKIKRGVPMEVVAPACGIHKDSFYYWIERGDADKQLGRKTIYSEFSDSISAAKDELEASLAEKWVELATNGLEKVKRVYREQIVTKPDGSYEVVKYLDRETVETIGAGDIQGISEFLLRRYAHRWARKEGVELTGKDGGPIETHTTMAIDSLSMGLRGWLLLELEGKKLPNEIEMQVTKLIGEVLDVEA